MLKNSWIAFEVGFAGIIATLFLCFMVSPPFCTAGRPWLPDVTGHGVLATGPSDLRVTINRDGVAWIENPRTTLHNALATRRYQRVIIEADRKTKFGALTPIFRTAQAHGVVVVFVGKTESVLEAVARR